MRNTPRMRDQIGPRESAKESLTGHEITLLKDKYGTIESRLVEQGSKLFANNRVLAEEAAKLVLADVTLKKRTIPDITTLAPEALLEHLLFEVQECAINWNQFISSDPPDTWRKRVIDMVRDPTPAYLEVFRVWLSGAPVREAAQLLGSKETHINKMREKIRKALRRIFSGI